ECGKRAREGVDLVLGELGAVGQGGLLGVQQALEAQHQRVARAPLERRGVPAGVELAEGRVYGEAARGSRREIVGALAGEQDRLPKRAVASFRVWLSRSPRPPGSAVGATPGAPRRPTPTTAPPSTEPRPRWRPSTARATGSCPVARPRTRPG